MCCFYPTKQWCQKQVVFVNGKEGTLVLGSPTGPWPWPPPNLARSKVVGNMRFLRKKSEKMAVWADLRHGFHVFGCCESGVDSDAFISSSQYMARCMSFNPSCHLLTTYHPITHLKSPGCRTDCCAPSFYLGQWVRCVWFHQDNQDIQENSHNMFLE